MIVRITDGLYLGDLDYTRDVLETVGIDYIISLTYGVADDIRLNGIPSHIVFEKIYLEDGSGNKEELYPEIVSKVTSHIDNDQIVLVHCRAGLSRSVFICILYLMSIGYPLKEALAILDDRRTSKHMHPTFLRYLFKREFEGM